MYYGKCNGKNGCSLGDNINNRDWIYICMYILFFAVVIQMEFYRKEMDSSVEMDKN